VSENCGIIWAQAGSLCVLVRTQTGLRLVCDKVVGRKGSRGNKGWSVVTCREKGPVTSSSWNSGIFGQSPCSIDLCTFAWIWPIPWVLYYNSR